MEQELYSKIHLSKTLIFCLVTLLGTVLSCRINQEIPTPNNKTSDIASSEDRVMLSAPLVLKPFIKKNGESSGQKEWYVQRSIQDYYIKFCESEVSRSELESHLNRQESSVPALKLEVAFREGAWDRCTEDEVQSRVGPYLVIYRIISSK